MLFKSRLHFVSALTIAFLLLLSFSGNHPAGNTGAPGDGICSNCHTGGGGGFDGFIDISGIPSVVEPGNVYNVTMTLNVTMGSPVRGGFQVVSLLDSDDTNAGDWFNNGSGSSLVVLGGREYLGHSPAQNFNGNTEISWTCDWVPPSVSDDVTFYAVGNIANGSGSSGDKIVTNTLTVTIEPPVELDISFSNVMDVSCFGESDGSALASATGGSSPYEFEWDNGEDEAQATMLSAGNRTVTVTDNDGNSAQASVNIGTPDDVDIDPFIQDVSCFDAEDGIIELFPFGGDGDYTCNWSDGVFDECERDGLSGGLYFITVTDGNNCSGVFDIELEEPELLLLNITTMDESMAGNDGSITSAPTGGTSPYEFVWSNGVQDDGLISTIDGLTGGKYNLIVTDDNGCTEEIDITISSMACELDGVALLNNIDCFGDSTGLITLNLNNATDPVSYLWSDGSTNDSLIGVPAGVYSVVVTDGVGCELIFDQMAISQADELLVNTISVGNTSCSDSDDGSIIINVFGGVGDYDLSWSNGATNDTTIIQGDTLINIPDTLMNLMTGVYVYTLLDGNQCVKSDSIIISNGDTQPPLLIVQQGIVYLDSMGNAPAATFDLVDAGSNDNCGIDSVAFMTPGFTCADIASHDFEVELFDEAGNSTSGRATINVIDTIGPVIDCGNILNIETNSCAPIDYPIPTATDNCQVDTIQLIDGLPSGVTFPTGTTVVTYAAVDDCGNSATCSINITVDVDLDIQIDSIIHVTCWSESDGAIQVNVTGGMEPYMIMSSAGSLEELPAGDYIISVADANGCTASITATITEPAPFTERVDVTDVSCKGETDGMIDLDAFPDNVSWEINAEDHTMLAPGMYVVTITDAGSGCETLQFYTVEEPEELVVELTDVTDPLCHDSDDCMFSISIAGGSGSYTILTDPEDNFCSQGFTLLIVEDSNGCVYEEGILFMVPDSIATSNVEITDATQGISDGSVVLDVTGGTGNLNFAWTNENGDTVSVEEDLLDVSGGVYILAVTDANGCQNIFEYTVGTMTSTVDLDASNERVRVYPNPATEILNLEFIEELPLSVEVYDITGQQLQKINVIQSMGFGIDLSAWANGIYLVRIAYDEDIVLKRISKI